MKTYDIWDTSVFHNSPIIKQLSQYTEYFNDFKKWPTINEYCTLFNKTNHEITPVPQSYNVLTFEEQYEPRVYLKKELQTRTQNWHDFFNAIIWLQFPKTKKTLNDLHYSQAKNRPKGSNRSLLENRITQFDECGAVIISKNQYLLDLVKQHKWQELFVTNRKLFETDFHCIIFGHAIFEKAVEPYIGMTCHCLLINENELPIGTNNELSSNLDLHLSNIWTDRIAADSDKFDAFPILGIPGYWPDQQEAFYNNKNYFR